MRRMLAVLGVAATFAIGQTALAGSAMAKGNDTSHGTTVQTTGGNADGPNGGRGGAGNRTSLDTETGATTFSGGGGAGGGPGFGGKGSGFGEHCDSDWTLDPCVGGGSPN